MASPASGTRSTNKRESISPRGDARYAKRDTQGQWTEMDDVGRSQGADRARPAKRTVKPGFGDQGDQTRPARAPKKR